MNQKIYVEIHSAIGRISSAKYVSVVLTAEMVLARVRSRGTNNWRCRLNFNLLFLCLPAVECFLRA